MQNLSRRYKWGVIRGIRIKVGKAALPTAVCGAKWEETGGFRWIGLIPWWKPVAILKKNKITERKAEEYQNLRGGCQVCNW